MWLSSIELQNAYANFLSRSGPVQRALEVFLYAAAFCSLGFGLAAIVNALKVAL
jgi:hypothetical protein